MSFSHWQCAPGVTAILCLDVLPGSGSLGGYGRTFCYLVEDRERALLFDNGFGINDLAAYVSSLTQLSLTVVNSHVHPDHVGGNAQFPTVLVGEHELPSLDPVYFPAAALPEPQCDAVINVAGYRFAPLSVGESIELGVRALTVVEILGHTTGSIALLDTKRAWLLLFCGGHTSFLLIAGLTVSCRCRRPRPRRGPLLHPSQHSYTSPQRTHGNVQHIAHFRTEITL